jgi:hypothetical protein
MKKIYDKIDGKGLRGKMRDAYFIAEFKRRNLERKLLKGNKKVKGV